MAYPPPSDRDPPPPGGFDPRFGKAPGGRGRGVPDEPYRPATDPFDSSLARPLPPRRSGLLGSDKLLFALGGLLLLGLILFGLSLTSGGPGSDALDGEEQSEETAAAELEERCAAPATYDKIKRELFREAATARGADLAVYDRLAGFASIRVTDPLLVEGEEAAGPISCSATVAIDLPPGVELGGGRQSIAAKLDYGLQPAADGSGDVVTLAGADGLIRQLASLQQSGAAPPPDPLGADPDPAALPGEEPVSAPDDFPEPAPEPEPVPVPPSEPEDGEAIARPTPRPQASADPSFNCARAGNRAERAICGDAGLAALDRQMSNRFFAARREANATQRALLDRTRGSFLAFRNRCATNDCIAGAYRDRIREIDDIMADRWVAPD